MTTPLVSICVPCLNTRPYLPERMETILSQTVKDWEVIVCDSFSNDGSWEFFQKFRSDKRVRLFQVPREGLYAGWNECLRRARGEYIYIATSDDTMEPELLERLLAPLMQRPEIDIAVCDFYRMDEWSQRIPRGRRTSDALGEWVGVPSIRNGKTEFLFHLCCYSLWSTMNSVLFRRKLLDRVGFFPTLYGSFGDLDWSLRACLASDIAWVPQELAGFRYHSGQATPRRFEPKHYRLTMQIQKNVVRNAEVGIPEAWKTMSHLEERLLACSRSRYRLSLDLYRENAWRHPVQFMDHFMEAVWREPRWLLGWLRHGFRYTGADFSKADAYAYELINCFNAPWPPRRVENGW